MFFMTFLFLEEKGLVEFSKVSDLFIPCFLCAYFNPEAIAGILIAHTPSVLYLVLCISSLRSLVVLYTCVQ